MSSALILIDIQNDYFPGGKMELSGSSEAGERAREVLSFHREKKIPVIHIRHLSLRPGATFFLPGTPGSEIHQCVAPLSGEAVVEKHFPNSFRETELGGILEKSGIKKLIVCGMMTHMCVDATIRAAFDAGYACTLVHDACATRDLSFGKTTVPAAHVHAAFLSALAGTYANVVGARELIANWA